MCKLSPIRPELAVGTSGYEVSEGEKKRSPWGLRRKERSIRYLIRRYRGLHNVKTRDGENYGPEGPQRLYGFAEWRRLLQTDRKSTRLNSSHVRISYAVFCLKKKRTVLFLY